MALHVSRASAQWWHRAPADYEDCAEAAGKLASKEEKSAAIGECSAKFAGRRKAGGGYTYYDFMQDRSFDIAGPNPTPEEQKYIDEQYTVYLENQRRSNIAAAYAKQQQIQLEQASLKSEPAPAPNRCELGMLARGIGCELELLELEIGMLGVALRAHRNVFARGHRERARDETRNASSQDRRASRIGRGDADDETGRRKNAVVRAEHGRAQPARALRTVRSEMIERHAMASRLPHPAARRVSMIGAHAATVLAQRLSKPDAKIASCQVFMKMRMSS